MRVVWAVVLLHTALILAHTLPARWVPGRLAVVAQWYVRPVFHQQWRLFAPDPPHCSCVLRVQVHDTWRPLVEAAYDPAHQRALTAACRYVQQDVHAGRVVLAAHFVPLLRSVMPADAPLELVEHCITDPQQPEARSEHRTPITWP